MYDFGAAETHSNYITYDSPAATRAPAALSIAMILKREAIVTAGRSIFGILHTTGGQSGWEIRTGQAGNEDHLGFIFGTGAAWVISEDTNKALSAGVHYHLVLTFDQSNTRWYWDGGSANTVAASGSISSSSDPITVGNYAEGKNAGHACDLGQIMVWDATLTADEALSVFGGGIPQADNLQFWTPCHGDPGQNLVTGGAGTKGNTVNLVERADGPSWVWPGVGDCLDTGLLNAIFQVISETMGLASDPKHIKFVYKVLAETLGLSSTSDHLRTYIGVVSETMGLADGDTQDGIARFDPDGIIIETMSDGTVWTRKFPPFARKTYWTAD